MTADRRFEASSTDAPDAAASRPARVAMALTRQLDLYHQLDALSLRQGILIDDDDTDGLLAVLGKRQAVVDQITAIGAELEPIRQRWEPFLAGLPAPTRGQLTELVSELAGLAGIVAARDEADRTRLEARRSAVGRELASVARGRSAVVAYGGKSNAVPFFQDREA